jgi:hypothetical protein
MFTVTGNIITPKKEGITKIICHYEDITAEKTFEIRKILFQVENMDPPSVYYNINEGSCGEAALWTICQYFGDGLTQEEINMIGGNPGRGLHSNEVIDVLDSLRIPYKLTQKASTWETSVDTLITIIKRGNPIFLGVKIYPDRYPQWYADHFILVTGLNTKYNYFYYNSFTETATVTYEKFLNTEPGYSLINKYNTLFAIEILLPPRN